ncbi:MAG: hypothetical protein EOM26_12115 [Alphaproteobacteria bacterium]|nr:hypothetical protein [Alphaproteobacteria bacterium]
MRTRKLNIAKPDYEALQDELERRYGPSLAQDIVDQIRRAEDEDFIPEYMAVKAASEALELFREETRQALRKLRQASTTSAANDNGRLVNFEAAKLRTEFERRLGLYFVSQYGFYRMYRKALKKYSLPGYEKSREQEMARKIAIAG